MKQSTTESPLASDLLRGVKAIAEYIGEPERRVYYCLEKGQLPGNKVGAIWYGRKSALNRHFGGEAA